MEASDASRPAPPRGRSDPPVFPVSPGEPELRGLPRRSRNGRRRAIVLGAVHVLILLHIVHWKTSGRTISPVEPSEAMRTFELGQVNAGFLFLVLAVLSTMIFGRFFCGWGCHLVALQDSCRWLLHRMGIRPRPLRSRLLAYAPLALALYMFVWPTLHRLLVAPVLAALSPGTWGTSSPGFPGFSNHLMTEGFWESFPSPWVAVPFLAICGFAAVYLLGAKGFCTYGCPYGAIFGAAERLAPGRVRVTDACGQCGQCTAVCSSNVRVHEEVREYGMVVDPGCMKCLDCVGTCPNEALYFGFGRPANRKPPRRSGRLLPRDELPRSEEIVLGAVFVATLLAHRGVYDRVPLLMAVGIAICTAFLAWNACRLAKEPAVLLHGRALKRAGRVLPAGWGLLAVATAAGLLTTQSGLVRLQRARGEAWDRRVTVTAEAMLSPDRAGLPDGILAAADRAAAHYRRADAWWRGGWGLVETPEILLRRAWLEIVRGRFSDAATHLRRVIEHGKGGDAARIDLARVLDLGAAPGDATAELERLIAENPALTAAHRTLAGILEREGRLEEAVAELVVVVNVDPEDGASRRRLAELLERLGRHGDATRYR